MLDQAMHIVSRITTSVRRFGIGCLLFAAAQTMGAAPEKVVLQLPFTHQFQFAGYYAAEFKGFFREAGLEVTIVPGTSSSTPLAELRAGRAQYAIGQSAILVERLKGASLVMVMPVFQHSPMALLVPVNSDIRNPEDLVGKRVAMGTSGSYLELQVMLLLEGLRPDSYRRVPNRPDTGTIESGESDAESAWLTDAPYDLKQHGFQVRIIRPSEYGVDFYGDTLYTSEQEAGQHPRRVAAMREAVREGWRYALEHPQEVIAWIEQNCPNRPTRVTRARLEYEAKQIARLINADLIKLGSSNEARWRKIGEEIVQLHLAPNLNRFAGFFFEPDEEERLARRLRLVGWAAGIAGLLALLGWWANSRLHRLVERRTRELHMSEASRQRVFEKSSIPILVLDAATLSCVDCNQAAVELYGFGSREEALGKAGLSVSAPFQYDGTPSSEKAKILITKALAEGAVVFEWRHQRLNGEVWDAAVHLMAYESDGRQLLQFTVQDITNRKLAETAQKESEERFRTLSNASFEGIVISEQGHVLDVNDQALVLFGADRADMIGHAISEFIAPEYRDKVASAVAAEATRIYEHQLLRKDGTAVMAEARPRMLRQGDRLLRITALRDISERKQAEADREILQSQLTHAQKMESVGRLAGGVAHDFNNMLTAIQGNASLALDGLPPGSPLRENLEQIQQCAHRSAELTRQLLAFARKQTITPKLLDLNAAVDGTLKMLRRLIGENIDLQWRPSTGLRLVRIDPNQIDQVLANLCVNSRDAISGVGTIVLESANAVVDDRYCATHPGVSPGDYVLLTASDNGCGMDKEVLSHVFEPFFTTKGIGQGTGLGLATVYGIVTQNGGFIDVSSEPGKGTTFKVYLPAQVEKAAQFEQADSAKPTERGHETILLVEDEPTILRVTQLMLARLGYTVVAATTPGDAIGRAETHAGEIHLLLTDVVMPEMNGRELAKRLLSLYPNLKRVFMSGYTANVIAPEGVLEAGIHFIQKPFSMETLANKVRVALDEV